VNETLKQKVDELEQISMKQFEQNKHLSNALERAQIEIKQLTLNPNMPKYVDEDVYLPTTSHLVRENKINTVS